MKNHCSTARLWLPGLALLASLGATAAQAAPTALFTLERTTNANQVIYELRDDDSIHPYWRMLAQDGHTEELTGFERAQAYGVVLLGQGEGTVQFSVKALPAYPITVYTNPPAGHPYATLHLLGLDRTVKRIYLHVSGGLFPSVNSIDLETQNGDSGPLLYFNLIKNGGSFNETQIRCASEWTPGC